MTQHWQISDADRAAHPEPATTNHGVRDYTPDPNPADIVRNFGRPYEQPTDPT